MSEMRFIDMRSDTVTLPTDEMREAMAKAVVGDDVMQEDPTVRALQALAAEKTAAKAEGRPQKNLSFDYDILTVDDLLNLAKELFDHIPKVLFLVHRPSSTVLLCSSGKPDCGKLVKENASIYGGKGGGGATAARAIFAKDEYVDTFIDLIDKHLR